MVSGTAPVWIERDGRLRAHDVRFGSRQSCAMPSSGSWRPSAAASTRQSLLCDAGCRRLAGERGLPPLAIDGPGADDPALSAARLPEDLVAAGTLPAPLARLLDRAVRARCTILVCGGTGSGKTTT